MSAICESCGDTLGSRYHEVARAPDVETASVEDLEAAAEIYARTIAEYVYARLMPRRHGESTYAV